MLRPKKTIDLPAMLSPERAAALLDMNPETIRRYIREGRLKATKIGNRWKISESDLAAFLGSDERARELMKAT